MTRGLLLVTRNMSSRFASDLPENQDEVSSCTCIMAIQILISKLTQYSTLGHLFCDMSNSYIDSLKAKYDELTLYVVLVITISIQTTIYIHYPGTQNSLKYL